MMFKHLTDVCMDYNEHFTLSIGFSFKFLKGSIYALIHALFPNMYASSTTKIVKDIQYKIKNSGCNKMI